MTDPLRAFRLDDRVVIVTGASSGLGTGFARAVAGVGGKLVLVARREDRLRALADQLRTTGSPATVCVADVSDPADCGRVVEHAVETFGGVDVLVNNAGIANTTPASSETPESFSRVLEVNLHGAFWMAQACAQVMSAGSSVVNIASVLGLVASRFPQASYSASKAGLIGLTRDLAQQWTRRKGIRVNALCPGFFASEMTDASAAPLQAIVAEYSMLGRFGEPDELNSALLFLASSASAYVTGTTLTVDGGLTAW